MKSRLNKKAISSVFQYIFALVAGAIILIFFIQFAFKAEKSGGEVIKAEVLQMLDSSLQAFSISTYSSGVLPTPPWPQIVDMKFGTGANCGKFTVIGQKYFVSIERVLFGPSEMKAKQLQTWTVSWYFPFRVTNIFFLNNQGSKYYLIYNAENEEFVRSISSNPTETAAAEMEHLPKIFDVKYVNSETEPKSKLKTVDMVKVNYFKPIGGVSQGLKGSYIQLEQSCQDEKEPSYNCFGTVQFYDGNKKTGSSTFIGRELMFGAIMADTIEEYECQYNRALNDLERMVNVYIAKAEKLEIKKRECKEKYLFMINMLRDMKQRIEDLRKSNDYQAAATLSSYAEKVKEYNEEELAGVEDCEMLF